MDYNSFRVKRTICFVLLFVFVKGEEFRLSADENDEDSSKVSVFCKGRGEPLLLRSPFDPELVNDPKFVFFQWLRKANDSDKETSIIEQSKNSDVKVSAKAPPRVSVIDRWSLQIDPVTFEDSATYIAGLMMMSLSTTQRKEIRVVVAAPPTLASKSLELKKELKGGNLDITCGQVASLGTPPVAVVVKNVSGAVLESSYTNGVVSLALDAKTEMGELQCMVEDASPAKQCIPPADLIRWDASIQLGQSTSSADTTGIVLACVAVAVVLLIIIVVAVCLVKRRKASQDKQVYYTKSEEDDNHRPMIPTSDPGATTVSHSGNYDEDERDITKAPYLPSKASSASPYMVTGIELTGGPNNKGRNNNAPDNLYLSSPVNKPTQPPEPRNPPPPRQAYKPNPSKQAPLAKTDEGIGGGGDVANDKKTPDQRPPVAAKRTKLMTASTEGLNRAVEEEEEEARADYDGRGRGGLGTMV